MYAKVRESAGKREGMRIPAVLNGYEKGYLPGDTMKPTDRDALTLLATLPEARRVVEATLRPGCVPSAVRTYTGEKLESAT
jgi:hypothetical protein